jgi:short-subunit dehydrogenase
MRDLRGCVAIVTGASMGIGAATARVLAAVGCDVALAARSRKRIEATAVQLRREYGSRGLAVPTDVTERAQVNRLVERVESELGGVDILVNCAGVGLYGAVAEVDEAELRYLFDVNLFGPVWAMQAAVPAMRRRDGGTIVNVNSTAGQLARPQLSMSGVSGSYSASKFALRALGRAARAELHGDGIHVINVYPGRTHTQFGDHIRVGAPGYLHPDRTGAAERGAVSPDIVARRIVLAIRRQEREVFVTWWDRVLVVAAQSLPGLYDWLLRRKIRARRQAGG